MNSCGLSFEKPQAERDLEGLVSPTASSISPCLSGSESAIAGFFTGFEIGSLAEQTSLLQYSGVLALISGRKT
jgi:hypothetical protein